MILYLVVTAECHLLRSLLIAVKDATLDIFSVKATNAHIVVKANTIIAVKAHLISIFVARVNQLGGDNQ